MRRVVIDTNVLVSGLLFGGAPGALVSLWKEGTIRPLCSRESIEEFLRVLSYPKFTLTEVEIEHLLTEEMLPYFEVITVKAGKRFVLSDASDDKFIWCALKGKARVIISGDDHLLSFASSPVPIVTVQEFLKRKGR